jgi:hypothetical protein
MADQCYVGPQPEQLDGYKGVISINNRTGGSYRLIQIGQDLPNKQSNPGTPLLYVACSKVRLKSMQELTYVSQSDLIRACLIDNMSHTIMLICKAGGTRNQVYQKDFLPIVFYSLSSPIASVNQQNRDIYGIAKIWAVTSSSIIWWG